MTWTCIHVEYIPQMQVQLTGEDPSSVMGIHVLVNVPLRVHYGNYWTKGCGREANTARASAASECCIRLETTALSQIIPVVYERKRYINWFVVRILSSFDFAESLSLKNASQS